MNSEISVHRSNNRHLVNISKENLLNQVVDLNDSDISTVETKRGIKIQAHKNNCRVLQEFTQRFPTAL